MTNNTVSRQNPNIIDVPDENLVDVPDESGRQRFEAEIQKRLPQARSEVNKMTPEQILGAYQPLQFGNVPFVGSAYNKAIDLAKAALGQGEGPDFNERYYGLQAGREAGQRALYEKSPLGYNLSKGTTSSLGMLVPELGIEKALAEATKYTAPFLAKTVPYFGRMLESGVYNTAASPSVPGESPSEATTRMGEEGLYGALAAPIGSAISKSAELAKNAGRGVVNLFRPDVVNAEKIVANAQRAPAVSPSQRKLTVKQYLDALNRGENVSLADVEGAKPEIIKAQERLPESPYTSDINQKIDERIKGNSKIIGDQIDDAAGRVIDSAADRDASYKAYRSAAAPKYNAAFNDKGADAVWNPYFDRIISSDEGQAAIKWADNERVKDGILEPSPFVKDPQTGLYSLGNPSRTSQGPVQPPDLEYWDYVKRGLNSIWRKQKASPGEGDTAASTGQMMHSMTDILRSQFKPYGEALDTAQRYIKADNAFDAGSDFFSMISRPKGNAEDISRQMSFLENAPKAGGYSPQEKAQFKTGLMAFMKENPDAASKLFREGDQVSMDRLRSALGDDIFEDVNAAFKSARIRELTGELGLSKGNKQPSATPMQIAGSAAFGTGSALTAGAGAYELAQRVPNLAETVTNPYVAGTAALVGSIAIPAAYFGKKVSTAVGNARAESLLRMAVDQSPQSQKALRDALNSDMTNKIAFDALEKYLTRFVQEQPSLSPSNREGRKSGGRAGVMSAASLLADLKRRKVMLANKTEQMLSLPDDAVVQALDAAKR